MYPLAITFVFLTLLGILTTSEIKSYAASRVEQTLHASYIQSKEELQMAQAKAHFDNLPKDKEVAVTPLPTSPPRAHPLPTQEEKNSARESNKPPSSLKINLNRPPNSSRLNIAYLIFRSKEDTLQSYEIFARLVRNLYGKAPFFKNIPHFEYLILDRLIANHEKMEDFTTPDELCKISFDDTQLQEAFYLMMKGSGGQGEGQQGFPSLLFFITFDKPKENKWTNNHFKTNLLFAAPEILEAIFQNGQIVEGLVSYRNGVWKEILMQEANRLNMKKDEGLNRTKIRDELKKTFSFIVSQHGLESTQFESLFDFSLGKSGDVLLVQDKKTGITLREKLPSLNKKQR